MIMFFLVGFIVFFFFFKQKTAYERRISDWSSDVCSSDLFVLKNPEALTEELIDIRHDIYAAEDYKRSVKNIMCLQDMEIRQRNLLTMEELAKIEAPTLVVWTHDDPTATLEDGKNYANGVRDSRFVVFNNSSHMPQLEEPERFTALHLAFIADPASVQSNVDMTASSNSNSAINRVESFQ